MYSSRVRGFFFNRKFSMYENIKTLQPLRYQDVSRETGKFCLELLEETEYQLSDTYGNIIHYVRVPKGFRTDLGSVPKILEWIVSSDGPQNEAYILHDAMYSAMWLTMEGAWDLTRHEADSILELYVRICGLPHWQATLIHEAVSIAGESHWRVGA